MTRLKDVNLDPKKRVLENDNIHFGLKLVKEPFLGILT